VGCCRLRRDACALLSLSTCSTSRHKRPDRRMASLTSAAGIPPDNSPSPRGDSAWDPPAPLFSPPPPLAPMPEF